MSSDTPNTDIIQSLNTLQSTIDSQSKQIEQLRTDLATFQTETAKLINAQFMKIKSQSLNERSSLDEPYIGPDNIKIRKSSSGRLTKSSSWEIRKKADLKPISETI